jgi:hypothetical protein
MKRWILLFVLVCGTVFASVAQGPEFTLYNESGSSIDAVYLLPSDSYDLGSPLLDDGPIEDQDSGELSLDAESEAIFRASGVDRYNLTVFFDDGSSRKWEDIDLDGITVLTVAIAADGTLVLTLR